MAAHHARVALYAQRQRAPDVRHLERELLDVARLPGESRLPRVKLFYYEHASDIAAATGLYAGGVTYPGLGGAWRTALLGAPRPGIVRGTPKSG